MRLHPCESDMRDPETWLPRDPVVLLDGASWFLSSPEPRAVVRAEGHDGPPLRIRWHTPGLPEAKQEELSRDHAEMIGMFLDATSRRDQTHALLRLARTALVLRYEVEFEDVSRLLYGGPAFGTDPAEVADMLNSLYEACIRRPFEAASQVVRDAAGLLHPRGHDLVLGGIAPK